MAFTNPLKFTLIVSRVSNRKRNISVLRSSRGPVYFRTEIHALFHDALLRRTVQRPGHLTVIRVNLRRTIPVPLTEVRCVRIPASGVQGPTLGLALAAQCRGRHTGLHAPQPDRAVILLGAARGLTALSHFLGTTPEWQNYPHSPR